MKLIIDDSIYVQKIDIDRLNRNAIAIPESIYIKYKKNEYKDDSSFLSFNKKEEIEYFNNLDCIINYDDVKDLTDSELTHRILEVIRNKDKLHDAFYKLNEKEKVKNLDMYFAWEFECIKVSSLKDCLLFKRGALDFKLPKDNSIKKFVKRICDKKVK